MTSTNKKSIKDSKDTINELNIDGVKKSLWLVKLPKFVSEAWSTVEDGSLLGVLNASAVKDSSNQIIKKINVVLDKNSFENDPVEFTLDEITTGSIKSTEIIAFQQESTSNQYSLVGKCTKSYILKPKDTPQYHEIRRKRLLAETTRKEAQPLDKKDVAARPVSSSAYIIDLSSNKSKDTNKRSRLTIVNEIDTNLVRRLIFAAFNKEERLLMSDILTICARDIPGGITQDQLKSVLDNYAVLAQKGMYKSYWELKPEFKDNAKLFTNSK